MYVTARGPVHERFFQGERVLVFPSGNTATVDARAWVGCAAWSPVIAVRGEKGMDIIVNGRVAESRPGCRPLALIDDKILYLSDRGEVMSCKVLAVGSATSYVALHNAASAVWSYSPTHVALVDAKPWGLDFSFQDLATSEWTHLWLPDSEHVTVTGAALVDGCDVVYTGRAKHKTAVVCARESLLHGWLVQLCGRFLIRDSPGAGRYLHCVKDGKLCSVSRPPLRRESYLREKEGEVFVVDGEEETWIDFLELPLAAARFEENAKKLE